MLLAAREEEVARLLRELEQEEAEVAELESADPAYVASLRAALEDQK
jgi:hypothetical protein